MPSMPNSTGSSSVIIFRDVLLSSFKILYKVVDLPEPVGPTSKAKPLGWLTISLMLSNSVGLSESLLRLSILWSKLNKRKTASNP